MFNNSGEVQGESSIRGVFLSNAKGRAIEVINNLVWDIVTANRFESSKGFLVFKKGTVQMLENRRETKKLEKLSSSFVYKGFLVF